ncbi:hypothetical protein [Nostoc sp. JL31]|nr:hypothetical protein [Nostoc sp. JL31]
MSRSQSPTGNAVLGAAASLAGGRAAIEVHFQPRSWKRDLTRLLA